MNKPPIQHSRHVSHVGEGLHSLSQVPELHNNSSSRTAVQSLNLHSNAIQAIDGLQLLSSLTSLNLSSNNIRLIENLSSLVNLTALNLASNCISELRGLEGLSKLQHLNVSYNLISSLQGITALHGNSGSLTRLNLQHNQLPSLQALAPLAGCLHLQQLKVGGNPCTLTPAAYAALRQALPHVQQLDESEAVSLAASWQMAHAQLQAYDAGQQQQHQQHQQHMSLMPPASQQPAQGADCKAASKLGSGRSPKHHTRKPAPDLREETSSTTSSSSSQSSMQDVEPPDTADAEYPPQQPHKQRKHAGGSSSRAAKSEPLAAPASPSKRAKPGDRASTAQAAVQTDDFITAAEVQLATEAQDLKQELSCLAGKLLQQLAQPFGLQQLAQPLGCTLVYDPPVGLLAVFCANIQLRCNVL